jgi:hypothetical protein
VVSDLEAVEPLRVDRDPKRETLDSGRQVTPPRAGAPSYRMEKKILRDVQDTLAGRPSK